MTRYFSFVGARLALSFGLVAAGGCQEVIGIGGECLLGSPGCGGAGGAGGNGGGGTGGATTTGTQTGGASTGGASTGGTGGTPDLPACGNGVVEPGELCFTSAAQHFPTQGQDARDLVVADCDADGDMDVIVTNFPEASLTALQNGGAGTFEQVVKSDSYDSKVSLALSVTGPSSFEVVALFAVSGRTLWFSQDPAVPCKFIQNISAASEADATDLVVFNANGNANPDVAKVIPGASGNIYLNLDHEIGSSGPTFAGASVPTAIAAGDLLGDEGEDLIITSTSTDELSIRENTGGGTFSNLGLYAPSGGLGDQPVDVQTGDLDGDGILDVVTANLGSGTIAVLRNLGGGTFATQAPEPKVEGDNGVPAASPRSVALGDVNNDGWLDAVTANTQDAFGASSVTVFLNDGTGKLVLATKASFPLVGADAPFEVGRQPRSVKLADLNGDGMLDIVTANAFVETDTSTISVLLSNP